MVHSCKQKQNNKIVVMNHTKKQQQKLRSFSTPNFPHPVKHISLLNPHTKIQSNQQQLIHHRKQIQSTLNQLHRLQSQIYQLNIPQNPHSTSPVKKQIKQLSYLYQNMTKIKTKNNLNVHSHDIQVAIRVINCDWQPDVKFMKDGFEQQVDRKYNQNCSNAKSKNNILGKNVKKSNSPIKNQHNNTNSSLLIDKSYKIPKKLFQHKLQQLSHCQLNPNFMSKNQKNDSISTNQLYQFINYTQCQNFDPIRQAYSKFLNDDGQFDLNIYNSFCYILGLPKIKNIINFVGAVKHCYHNKRNGEVSYDDVEENQLLNMKITSKDTALISFEQFKKVIDFEI